MTEKDLDFSVSPSDNRLVDMDSLDEVATRALGYTKQTSERRFNGHQEFTQRTEN